MNPFEKLEQYSINKLKQELADYKVNYFLQYHITGKLGEFNYVPIVERNMWELWQTGSALSEAEFSTDNELAEFAEKRTTNVAIRTLLEGKASLKIIEVDDRNIDTLQSLITATVNENVKESLNNSSNYVTNKEIILRKLLEKNKDKDTLEPGDGNIYVLKDLTINSPLIEQITIDRMRKEAVNNTTISNEGQGITLKQFLEKPETITNKVRENLGEVKKKVKQKNLDKASKVIKEKYKKQDTLLQEAQEGTFRQSAYVSQRVNALAKIFNDSNVDTAELKEKEVKTKIKLLSKAFREEEGYVPLKAKLQQLFSSNREGRKQNLIKRLVGKNPSKELKKAVEEFVESPKDAFTKDALNSLYRANNRNDLADELLRDNDLFKSYVLIHSSYKGANEQDTQVDRFIVTELNAIRAVNTVINSNARYFKWDVSDEHRRRGVICPVCYERSVRGYLSEGIYPRKKIIEGIELHIPKHPYCLCKWTPLPDDNYSVTKIDEMTPRMRRQIEEGFGDWSYVSNNWSKLAPVAKGLLLASISMAGLWFAVSRYRLRKSNAVENIARGVNEINKDIQYKPFKNAVDDIRYSPNKTELIVEDPVTKATNLILPVAQNVEKDTVLGDSVSNPSEQQALEQDSMTINQRLISEVKGKKTVIKDLESRIDEEGRLGSKEDLDRKNLLESLKQEYEERLGLNASINTTPQVELNLNRMTLQAVEEQTEEVIKEVNKLDKQVRELVGDDTIEALEDILYDTSKLTVEQRKQKIEEIKEALRIIDDKQFDITSFIKRKGETNEEEILYSLLIDNESALNNLEQIKRRLNKKLDELIELEDELDGRGQIKKKSNAVKLLEVKPELSDLVIGLNNIRLTEVISSTRPLFKKVSIYTSDPDVSWEEIIENLLANKPLTEQKKILRQILDDTLKVKEQYIGAVLNSDSYSVRKILDNIDDDTIRKVIKEDNLEKYLQDSISTMELQGEVAQEVVPLTNTVRRMNDHIIALNDKLDNVSTNLSKVNAPKKTKANDLRIVNKVTKFIESLPSRKNNLLLDRSISDKSLNEIELLLNELKQRKLDSNANIKKFFLQKENPINIADTINSFNPTKINNYLSDLSKLKEGVETNINILNTLLKENKLSPTEIDKAKEQLRYLQERLAYYNSYQERLLQVGRDINNLKKEGNYLSRKANYNINIGSINIEATTRAEKIRKLKREAQVLRGKISNDRNKEDKTVLAELLKRVEDEIRKTEIAEFRRYESNSNYLRYISATSNVLFSPIFKYMK